MQYSASQTAALYVRLFSPHTRPSVVLAARIDVTALLAADPLGLLNRAAGPT